MSNALQSLIHSLEEELRCPLCLDQFHDPRLLECYHNFCLSCLHSLVCSSGRMNAIVCPLCRHLTILDVCEDHDAVSTLPRNNYLSNIVEKLSTSSKSSSVPSLVAPLPSTCVETSPSPSPSTSPFTSPAFPPTAPGMDLSAFAHVDFEAIEGDVVHERLELCRPMAAEKGRQRRKSGEHERWAWEADHIPRRRSLDQGVDELELRMGECMFGDDSSSSSSFSSSSSCSISPIPAAFAARDEPYPLDLISKERCLQLFTQWIKTFWLTCAVSDDEVLRCHHIALYAVPFYVFHVATSSTFHGSVCTHRTPAPRSPLDMDVWKPSYGQRVGHSSDHVVCAVKELSAIANAIHDWPVDSLPSHLIGPCEEAQSDPDNDPPSSASLASSSSSAPIMVEVRDAAGGAHEGRPYPQYGGTVLEADEIWKYSGKEGELKEQERREAMAEMKANERALGIADFHAKVEVDKVHFRIDLPVYVCSMQKGPNRFLYVVNPTSESGSGRRSSNGGPFSSLLSRLWS